MTRFEKYINEENKIDWNKYVSGNPELKGALEIMKIITKKGYNALIVGGFVRDILLGIPSDDVDICSNIPQNEIAKEFETFDIGKNKNFGVTVIKHKGFDYEVANYRADIYSSLESGNGANKVELVKNFKADSQRRDFTINSLGIDYKGNVVDHNGGTNDMKMKVVSAVGDPKLRFKEDAIRMMRGVRFASKLDFDIESGTKDAIKAMAQDITKVSPERIRKELVKMASQTGNKFARAIELMDETGILDIILPEITKLKEYYETFDHHPESYEYGSGRVYDHILSALRMNKIENPLINLSVLLHDVAKNELTYQKIDGKHTYRGHATKAKDLIENIAKRLKLSNKEKDAILFACLNHMRMLDADKMRPTKIMDLVNNEYWEVLKAVSLCDDSCRIGLFDKKRFNDTIKNMELISKRWGDKVANKSLKVVDGKMVMKVLNIRPSKLVGDIIKKVTDEIVNNGSKESLDKLIKRAYDDIK